MDEGNEGHRHNRCSNCKQLGYNKARYRNPPVTIFSIGKYLHLLVCINLEHDIYYHIMKVV